jgi:hypothetical protein
LGLTGLLVVTLLAPVSVPYYGVRFVLKSLRDEVDREAENAEQDLQEELVALNMRLELGELTEEEFEAKEAVLLEQIRAARARNEADEEGGPS